MKCRICNAYAFAVVNNKGVLIDSLCGLCIKIVYSKFKKDEQTKLLL